MDNWRSNYTELTGYVADHPAIEISGSVMLIPDAERPEFYRLFNQVLSQFIKDSHPSILAEASLLSDNFTRARDKITGCMNLKAIEIKPDLDWFLEDAVGGLARMLFDSLFGLLQGKADRESFERQGIEVTGDLARALLHRGYLYWVTMSLIQKLGPDAIYSVPVDDESIDSDLTTADKRPGWWTMELPEVIRSDSLRLDVSQYTSFLAPQAILRLGRLNTLVSIRTTFYSTYHHAKVLSKRLEWLSREAISRDYGMGDLWPDMALYSGESENDLRVVADCSSVARPDVIVDVMEVENWHANGGSDRAKRHYQVLRPKMGSFVVCRHPVPPAVVDELQPEIKVLVAGYDACALVPIVDTISEARAR